MAHHTSSSSPHTATSQPGQKPTGIWPAPKTPSNADIARRAYEKYEARGRVDGFDLDDWIAASRELAGDTVSPVRVQGPSQEPRSP